MAMTNKFAGRCVRCGQTVDPGAGICRRSKRTGKYYVIHPEGTCEEANPDRAPVRAGRDRYVSDVFVIGGKEYYRNKKGRCIDAPCCGCCTI